MGLEINTIITLDNHEKYMVMNETLYQGKKYFLTLKLTDFKEIGTNEEVILEEDLEGLDIYVKKILDQELYSQLLKILKK